MSTHDDNTAAFLSLARAQRKMTFTYRRRAASARVKGDTAYADYCTSEARRLWASAKFHVLHARIWSEL